MTNHPNRKRTYYTVRLGNDIAKFSNYLHAMSFAAANSYGRRLVEVGHKMGIVGQYRDGKTTPEFAQHDKSYRDELARIADGDAPLGTRH
jgi:hypothetical protein